jgi:hypothetical protein
VNTLQRVYSDPTLKPEPLSPTSLCGFRQGHLEQAIAQAQERADEAEELRVLLEKKTSMELEGLKATYAVKVAEF